MAPSSFVVFTTLVGGSVTAFTSFLASATIGSFFGSGAFTESFLGVSFGSILFVYSFMLS